MQLYAQLEALGARLEAGFATAAKNANVDACVQRVGSMITLFFGKGPVRRLGPTRRRATPSASAAGTRAMLARGVYWPPSQFEAAFISNAHTDADIDRTIAACDASLA